MREGPLTEKKATPNRGFDLEVVQRMVRQSRLEQGLSERITDPVVLANLATMLVQNR